MDALATIILAAGKGTRMKSQTVKVLHPIAGIPMLAYPIKAVREAGCDTVFVVVGHQRERIEDAFRHEGLVFIHQEQQLGSGHAVAVTEPVLQGFSGDVLILCGDVPFISPQTLLSFIGAHRSARAALSVLSVIVEEPTGYGRIVRKADGRFSAIVEHRDATEEQRRICEINTGIYCCAAPLLFEALHQIGTDNDQGEYYLPDIVAILAAKGHVVQAVVAPDSGEVQGINDRKDLARAEQRMRERINAAHMAQGVTMIDPAATYIEAEVRIGPDTVIFPGTVITRGTVIGEGCMIGSACLIERSRIGSRVKVLHCSVIEQSTIADDVQIGPFAHLRPGTILDERVHIGNFVEVKKSTIGRGSKANHLTYIGDATIGTEVNVGAGTITCNYDGRQKHPTVIDDHAFIGSNTALVAPVTIGKHAVIGAGSTITKNVPDNALAVARGKQVHYEHYVRIGRRSQSASVQQGDTNTT
ncbi:MAG: bifunctional UDP-N-acetylglucosamine diphosphorylase/glucosamine-1-phosphate N-acetyltransferase GlmU [Desulfobacterota bacterium]|nr:bifunctional UDP-N-acetylglucosamine diphosphorylase/glucosamine-1-phosphate N-acetyltransferase GlmU [Thermodesulfobacteriota bacterium]